MNLTASNIVSAINRLSRTVYYEYPTKQTKTKVRIISVTEPHGPIKIERLSGFDKKEESMSIQMIQRYANAFSENVPVNIDRVLGASYNTRSSLEALLAHTPDFYVCYPKRIEMRESSLRIKDGHKHLIWNPTTPHPQGHICEIQCEMTISERPSVETVYGVVDLPKDFHGDFDIEVKRRHAQIQIALAQIGHQLGYRTYIAANDQNIQYNNKPIVALPGVVANLSSERILSAYGEARDAARLIDCVWFQNGRLMPAVMEVEHSTGVTSGLARMQRFRNLIPPIQTRWVIVAPDEDRDLVHTKMQEEQFADMKARFFPYSAVEELYALCEKRKIRGITEEFLDCFME